MSYFTSKHTGPAEFVANKIGDLDAYISKQFTTSPSHIVESIYDVYDVPSDLSKESLRKYISKKMLRSVVKQAVVLAEEDDYYAGFGKASVAKEEQITADGYRDIKVNDETIKTYEDFVRVCEIDLTKWAVHRLTMKTWEVGREDKLQRFSVHAVLKPLTDGADPEAFAKALVAELKSNPPQHRHDIARTVSEDSAMYALEVSIPDAHIGKLAWAEESGAPYNNKIARDLFLDAVKSLVTRARSAYDLDEIIFPIGNDFLHTDNMRNTTTGGTQMTVDGTWQQIFREGAKVLTEAIDYMTQYAPVKVIVVPGNHDHERAFYLGELLAAWYRQSQEVTIDHEAKTRKYHVFGKTLIGYAHGQDEKHKELPLIMATERKQDWADTDHKYFKLGHKHTRNDFMSQSISEFNGVRVSILPSLSATDAWHASKGYVGNQRAAEAFVYSPTKGQVANFTYTI